MKMNNKSTYIWVLLLIIHRFICLVNGLISSNSNNEPYSLLDQKANLISYIDFDNINQEYIQQYERYNSFLLTSIQLSFTPMLISICLMFLLLLL